MRGEAGWTFRTTFLINALVAGLLLGGFYAAVTVGVSISFGILDIVNIAHPAFIILGSYIAYIVNTRLGIDPILASIVMLPAFYALGALRLSGLLRLVREIRAGIAARARLLLRAAVRHRGGAHPGVRRRLPLRRGAPISGRACTSASIDLPLRMLVPCLVSLALFGALQLFLTRTFIGRAIMAVAQDQLALQLMGGLADAHQAHRLRDLDRDRRRSRARC